MAHTPVTLPDAEVHEGERPRLATADEADFNPDYLEDQEPNIPGLDMRAMINNAVQAVSLTMVTDPVLWQLQSPVSAASCYRPPTTSLLLPPP